MGALAGLDVRVAKTGCQFAFDAEASERQLGLKRVE